MVINCKNQTLVITDPCYLKSVPKMEASTLYGDWSCMVYPGELESCNLPQEWDEIYFKFFHEYKKSDEEKEQLFTEFKKIEDEWEEKYILGRFCADSGSVAVFFFDDLCDIDIEFINKHPWCATTIKDFTGTVEFYDSDDETRHVIGKGDKPFFSVQSGF